jgi:glycosyltransferase involved in cell wall biosynthesis
MRILLAGEYSGLHNNLKDGLNKLGHEVILAASGDGFKKFPADYLWVPNSSGTLDNLSLLWRINRDVKSWKPFDVVQFINPSIVTHRMGFNNYIIKQLLNKATKSFLLAAGDDYHVWKYYGNPGVYKEQVKYNWIKEIIAQNDVPNNLKDLFPPKWTEQLIRLVDNVIPIAYEYQQAYGSVPNRTSIIKMPINVDKVSYKENKVVNNKVVIIHGLNRESFKGTHYIREAFERLSKKYPNDLELIIQGKMSQKDYFDLVSRCNVILDQTNSYSLGMNALYSMAMGKVVLGGAEQESIIAHGYDYCPAINILPSVKDIEEKITMLLDKRDQIREIGYQSREFIEKHHHYLDIASEYEALYKRLSGDS